MPPQVAEPISADEDDAGRAAAKDKARRMTQKALDASVALHMIYEEEEHIGENAEMGYGRNMCCGQTLASTPD